MIQTEKQIFQQGSTTYYWSSQFFPKTIREDVFKLYSFVRVADNYVDAIPQQPDAFHTLRGAWNNAKEDTAFNTTLQATDSVDQRVIKNIVSVSRTYNFDHAWVESFLDSMQADLDHKTYQTIDDTLWYVYGSAEVIGLMMAAIMRLPVEATHAARLQGRAMQFINFIRDIAEDNTLGRCYIPQADLDQFGLPDLSQITARAHPEAFTALLHHELDRYTAWQTEATAGFTYIPRRLRIPLKTAVDMYNWTGQQIAANPMIVFDHKVKPAKSRIILQALKNTISYRTA